MAQSEYQQALLPASRNKQKHSSYKQAVFAFFHILVILLQFLATWLWVFKLVAVSKINWHLERTQRFLWQNIYSGDHIPSKITTAHSIKRPNDITCHHSWTNQSDRMHIILLKRQLKKCYCSSNECIFSRNKGKNPLSCNLIVCFLQ